MATPPGVAGDGLRPMPPAELLAATDGEGLRVIELPNCVRSVFESRELLSGYLWMMLTEGEGLLLVPASWGSLDRGGLPLCCDIS